MNNEIQGEAVEKVAEAVVEYQTKSIPVEVAAGRVVKFISPKGEEHLVRAEKVERFKRINGVDARWTVS